MNPLALIDSILEDWVSPRVRRLIHNLVLLVALVVFAFVSYEGDWREAAVALVAALYSWSNRANTKPVGVDEG